MLYQNKIGFHSQIRAQGLDLDRSIEIHERRAFKIQGSRGKKNKWIALITKPNLGISRTSIHPRQPSDPIAHSPLLEKLEKNTVVALRNRALTYIIK